MDVPRFSLVFLMFLVFASQFFVVATFAEVSEGEAALALRDAEGAVVSAFQVVLEAEQAGANVSALLSRLGEAGKFLAEARMAYRVGDFEKAAIFAGLSRDIGSELQNDAHEVRDLAWSERVERMWLTTIGSVVGVVVVTFGSLKAWRVFKRRYYARVLKMKPEVSSDES